MNQQRFWGWAHTDDGGKTVSTRAPIASASDSQPRVSAVRFHRVPPGDEPEPPRDDARAKVLARVLPHRVWKAPHGDPQGPGEEPDDADRDPPGSADDARRHRRLFGARTRTSRMRFVVDCSFPRRRRGQVELRQRGLRFGEGLGITSTFTARSFSAAFRRRDASVGRRRSKGEEEGGGASAKGGGGRRHVHVTWDRKDDYALFAAASILGVSDRAIARVAENRQARPRRGSRARLKVLLREPDPAGAPCGRVSRFRATSRWGSLGSACEPGSPPPISSAAPCPRAGARNTIDTRDAAGPSADVDDSKVDAREHVDLGVGGLAGGEGGARGGRRGRRGGDRGRGGADGTIRRQSDPSARGAEWRRENARRRARDTWDFGISRRGSSRDDAGVHRRGRRDGSTSTPTSRWIPSARCTACGVTRTTACCTGAGRHTLR